MTRSFDQPTESTLNARRRGRDTRRRLVIAAAELVIEHGWDRVTTRQIARRAGVNQGLIHYHFGTRDDLLHAAFQEALREAFSNPGSALAKASSVAEAAAELVRGLRADDEIEPIALFSMEAMARAARDDAVRHSMAAVLSEFRSLVAARIAAGQRTGELASALDPVGTATVLGALFDGLGVHLLIDPSIDVDRTAAALTVLLSQPKGQRRSSPSDSNG